MIRNYPFTTLLWITVAIATVTGCGATPTQPASKRQYERQVSSAEQEAFAKANPATILFSAQGGDPASSLLAVQQAAATEARELAKIAPPANIAQPHRRLIGALRAYAKDLGSIIGALRAHKLSPAVVPRRLRSLKSASAIRAARTQIKSRGYSIG